MTKKRSKLEAAHWGLRAVLGAAALGAAGCMVGPNYKAPPSRMPANYRELTTHPTTAPALVPATSPAEVRWWRRFGDPQLTSLVEQSVAANYSIAKARARLREARASRQRAQALLYPQIDVGASALRYRTSSSVISVPGLSPESSLYQVGFDASWSLDVFGGTRRGIESERASEQSAAADQRGTVLMIAAETARDYLELRGMQLEIQIAQMTLQEQRQTLRVTEDRRRNGLSSDLEVLRARTEVESTAAEIPPLEESAREYIHVISTLLGQEPAALAGELEQPAPLPSVSGQIPVGIPSDLLRRRPDIQSAERDLAAATADVGVAISDMFPQLTLGAAGGFSSPKTNTLFNSGSKYYLAGPAIDWTLFDAGRRKAAVRYAEAKVDAAKAGYEDTVLQAFREVENSLVAIDRDQEQVSDLRRLVASASESASISRRDYERGILDQLTVLDAQRQSDSAEMKLAEGRVQLATDIVTLYKALGGGWEIAEPPPSTQPTTIFNF